MEELNQLKALAGTRFAKMTGTGNDFILLDGRKAQIPADLLSALARGLCARRRSVGADGLIVLRPTPADHAQAAELDFVWDFFNADGSSAEMCGNGGRCAARFARDIGLAGDKMVFGTLAGPIRAQVGPQGDQAVVKLQMVKPFDAYRNLKLVCNGEEVMLDGVNTGVPHAVVFRDEVEDAPVVELGRQLRWHEHFQPAGSNVNFACVQGDWLLVRTYERGVEDETLACGTGVVASALLAGIKGLVKSPVEVKVRSGESLKVYFTAKDGGFSEVFLEGQANYVYQGVLNEEAFAWLGQAGPA